MKTLIQAAILTTACAVALAAQQPAPQPRQPGGPPAGGPPEGQMRERMRPEFGPRGGFAMMAFSPTALLEHREALSLTADQVTKLSTLETDLKTARDKARTDSKPHRDELQKLLEQSAPDVTQVRAHAQALMQAEQTGRLNAITTSVQAKAVLSPEQRGRVQGWADARGERMRGGRGMFRRGGGDNMMRRGAPNRPMGFGFRRGMEEL
jgi:Spy/CpxP family protein refolding chaperone